ncbi:MAG: cache domain-containing protein [Reyranella sp.]|uniref:cache domain-containing protein n=1 Tax=Reyranella sp. TaxID=1929291 RepID=UPI003D0B481E
MASLSPSDQVAPDLTALSEAQREGRPSRLRRALRHSLPMAGVVVAVVLVTGMAYSVYERNRRGAAILGNDLITAIDRRVAVQMESYFAPAQQFLELADEAGAGRSVPSGAREVLRFARHALATVTAATAFSYADPEGNFLFVIRNDKGSFDSKLVERQGEKRTVAWTRRDAQGKVVSVESDQADTFDPRTRPWYLGAERTKKPYWTDTYPFFTLKKPGITVSVPHFDADGKLQTVMAVDIELANLCAFLKQLDVGKNGNAFILDRSGRIVAYPSDDWLPVDRPDAKAPMLDELGDPLMTRIFNHLRVAGFGRQVLTFDDQHVIVSSEPVSMITDKNWVVVIVVPETDFVGFVADSAFATLLMSGLVVLIVAGLSGLLAWRSVAADRTVTAAAARQQALEARTRTFVELARTSGPTDGSEDVGLAGALETAATACAGKRVAVWRLNSDRTSLLCEDCFDRTVHDHTSGMELHRDQMPDLFAALGNGEPIDAQDASQGRTADLFVAYLKPLGTTSVYIVPIVSNGRLTGMITVEDPARGEHTASMVEFCDALAVVLALRYAAAAPPVPVAARAAVAAAGGGSAGSTSVESFATRESRLEQTLMLADASLDDLEENAIERATIAVLKLPMWTTVAKRPTSCEESTAMEAIVNELRRSIESSGLTYAALLDDQLVLAAFSGDKTAVTASARCVATAMLDLRDRLLELEERWNISLDFSFAIDIGTVMSLTVATDPPSRHLWGGAIGVAKVLSTSTARRTIAASETAYELLADRFLFRPRGTYFLPETGDMRTFVLVDRL